ncbi:DDB1- and CUL4-associated factor 8 [Manduca sexta]|uniref:DDB1- and CUL4-associated factor 8 n=1 Tax=Manduca sexta TaxID=7130 RepID=UPI00188EC693|nr:DDB1- and CUL4-associated factor 8 [Manduca sexta]
MDDNSTSDDEIKESPSSPKSGGKKVKLNDGSSQDSLKETAVASKDENMDSGVSADKSESTSSDDPGASSSTGPSNEVVIAAPSTSNVRTLLLNLTRPMLSRNYRKRKTPDRDSDSNASSKDSDDDTPRNTMNNASTSNNSNSNSSTDTEVEEYHRLIDLCSTGSDDSESGRSSSDTCDSDDMLQLHTEESSSDEDVPWNRSTGVPDGRPDNPPDVLLKERPKHNYVILREIMNRELGLTFPCGKTAKNDVIFEQKFYSSLHAVYRLKKLHTLNKHRGCVNSINFHPEGHLLASGSDDTNVVVWDWARKIPLQTVKTGHKSNVFQSKFLYLNSTSQLNIVTCARDGQVRLLQCGSAGGSWSRRRVAAHARAAHKLHVSPHEPHALLSAGEDGLVLHCDLRADATNRLFQLKERGAAIPLYSVHGHPLDLRQLVVAGRDKFVRVYDRRKASKPLALYCPSGFTEDNTNTKKKMRLSMMHLTCAIYNHDGTEILGSYNDEDIYLFNTKMMFTSSDTNQEKDGYTHRYTGHRNSATFKGVAFFGPRSEYVVSGSDCSHIYIWEKNSEAIVQWLQGDVNGVVNCIEPHPRFPILATSGLDKDVKIWAPYNHKDPTYNKLSKVIRENSASQLHSPLFNDFLPTLYSAWRGENRLYDDEDLPHTGNIEFDGNICTTF